MKKTALFLILSFLVANLYSQTETDKKNMFRTHVAPSAVTMFPTYKFDVNGAKNKSITEFIFVYGFDYSRQFSERRSFSIGFEHFAYDHSITHKSTTYPFN